MSRGRLWLLALVGAALVAWSALREKAVEVESLDETPSVIAPSPKEGPRLEVRAAASTEVPPRVLPPTADSSVGVLSHLPTTKGRLHGTVFGADGSVVAQARVQVSRQPTEEEIAAGLFGSGWRGLATLETSADGTFFLDGAPEGIDLQLEITPPWGKKWTTTERRTDAPLLLTLPRVYVLSGRVVDAVTREPIAGARISGMRAAVERFPYHPDDLVRCQADDEGKFQAHVSSPVRFEIKAAYPRHSTDSLGPPPPGVDVLAQTVVDADTTDIELRLWSGVQITGSIVVPGDAATPKGVQLQAYAQMPEGAPAQAPRAYAQVDPDGTFLFPALLPGTYDLLAVPPAPSHDAPRLFGKTWVRGVVAPSADVRVILADGIGVHGQLTDHLGAPVIARGVITVISQEDPLDGMWLRYATLDGMGGFQTPALDPDRDYVLLARFWGFVDRRVRGVRPGSEPLVIRLEAAGTIRGVVRDRDGKPVGSEVPVEAWASNGRTADPGRHGWTSTDAKGRFAVGGLSATTFDVVAGGSGSVYAPSEPVRNVELGVEGLELRVEPGSTIRGRLVDPQGNAVWGRGLWAHGVDGPTQRTSPITLDDPKGQFEIRGLRPGRVRLSFRRDRDWIDLGEFHAPSEGLRIVVPDP